MNESLKHETDTEDGLRKQVFHCDKAGPLGGAGSDNTAVRMFLNITAFRFFKKSFLAPASHNITPSATCAMHRPASAAFVEWEVETIIAMHSEHSDFRLLDLLGIYSMYVCFLFSPFFVVPFLFSV